MMKPASLEPGLLSVFRLFIGLRFGLALIALWVDGDIFNLLVVTLLLVYLWWPGLPRPLGRAFLPVGLVLAAADPIVGQYLELLAEFEDSPFDGSKDAGNEWGSASARDSGSV